MFSKKSVNMSVTCFQQDRSNGIWPLQAGRLSCHPTNGLNALKDGDSAVKW